MSRSARADAKAKDVPKAGLPARQAAATVLARIIDDKRGLDGLLDSRHGPPIVRTLPHADQSLLRAIVTTACRHRGQILDALSDLLERPLPKNARHLHHTLHVASAQILFMEVPDSAAVDLAVTALRQEKRSQRFANLGNAVLRRMAREKEKLLEKHDEPAAARLNMPGWLYKATRKSFGKERAARIALAHMAEPVIDVTVKSNPDAWAERLDGKIVFGNNIRTGLSGRVDSWPGYEEGAWWVQDAAASLPATLLGDIAGKRVADLCAAPGGKTAQLALAGGDVTALDASASRLARLQVNLDRLGLKAECIAADLMEWQPDELFDAILLDAPCSSTGTIRRHPDVQWTKDGETVETLAKLQRDMILRAANMLKAGGVLLFANCSLNRSEGEDIAATLDMAQAQLVLDPIKADEVFGHTEFVTGQGTIRTLPCHLDDNNDGAFDQRAGLDGFFAARFIKQ